MLEGEHEPDAAQSQPGSDDGTTTPETGKGGGRSPSRRGGGKAKAGKRRTGAPRPAKTLGLVTLRVLAQKLGLPLKWLRRKACAGELPGLRVGCQNLYDVRAVKKHLRDAATRFNQHGDFPNRPGKRHSY